jgi:sortase A
MRKAILIIALVVGMASAISAGATPQTTINIPAIHANWNVMWVANEHYLAEGPAWWPGTGRPGSGRTVAIAGHDVTPVGGLPYGPFHFLYKLNRGEMIYISYRGVEHPYRITDITTVSGASKTIAIDVGHERLILTTCWPPYSAAKRFEIIALPVS